MEEYIFVYGVFRDSGKGLLEGCKFCGKATVDGDIYRVNDFYPGFTRSKGKVIGDVYLINSSIFTQLDEFEGEEYQRKIIKTQDGIDCWVYEWILPTTSFKMIKSGDWLIR